MLLFHYFFFFSGRRTNIIGTLVQVCLHIVFYFIIFFSFNLNIVFSYALSYQDASPFLFPCTIEYSLICAAILYVMWRGICRPQPEQSLHLTGHSPIKRSPHHYSGMFRVLFISILNFQVEEKMLNFFFFISVDCARAHKGLFIGILILVLTIISLILFFVLISRPEFVTVAVTEVTITELVIFFSLLNQNQSQKQIQLFMDVTLFSCN